MAASFNVITLIDKKRNGATYDQAEIEFLVSGYSEGNIPDYQMSAWLMAVCCQGLNRDETFWLTNAMINSGQRLSFPDTLRPLIDKHSSGGVGDKVSMIVVPMIAACGGRVFKMSGRGLSHTGGTLDKLESIPGYRTDLSAAQAQKALTLSGATIIAQSDKLVPADKKIYALRDVTATVNNLSLIASSIISKKIAGGADVLVFDIKVGTGAFMHTPEEARQLAALMKYVAKRFDKRARFVLSLMDEPLGFAIGNRVEVAEAIRVLQGEHISGLNELCIEIAAQALSYFKALRPLSKAKTAAEATLSDGRALGAFMGMLRAHGAKIKDPSALLEPPKTKYQKVIKAGREGYIGKLDAMSIGEASRDIGAGRSHKDDKIDPEAGIILSVKVGKKVKPEQRIMTLYSNDKSALEAAANKAASGIAIRATKPQAKPLILDII